MSDIVERLREFRSNPESERWDAIAHDAVGEIERLRARVKELEYWNGAVAVCEEHVQDIVALDPKLCVICDEERLRDALREIATHAACSYDYHGPAQGDSDRQYQIGVTDGHRLAAKIARRALEDTP